MPSVSLINGHIDAPENGVYCKQCIYAVFDATAIGECALGRMTCITKNSYCTPGGVASIITKEG